MFSSESRNKRDYNKKETKTGCLLNYPYFKGHLKIIAIDLIKQKELDADPKPIQEINFAVNLD